MSRWKPRSRRHRDHLQKVQLPRVYSRKELSQDNFLGKGSMGKAHMVLSEHRVLCLEYVCLFGSLTQIDLPIDM